MKALDRRGLVNVWRMIALAALLLTITRTAAAAELSSVLQAIEDAPADRGAARVVRGVRIALPLGTLHLDGTLVPRRLVEGHVREAIFVGAGRIELAPPDGIERDQLERFTGRTTLSESFHHAVLVAGDPALLESLLAGAPPASSEADLSAASVTLASWSGSPARLGQWLRTAEIATLLDAQGAPPLLAAWIRGDEFGDFLYLDDRDREQPVRVVQYGADAPLRPGDPRAGGLADDETEDPGRWDTWIASGEADPAFRTVGHRLSARVTSLPGELAVTSTMTLEARQAGRRTARLLLDRELELDAVTLNGETLSVAREGTAMLVVLPDAPPRGGRIAISILYHGSALVPDPGGGFRLLDSANWHPRSIELDRATYDVTFRWPRAYELQAAGREVEGGSDGAWRWSRRVTDGPALLFPFAIGNFRTLVARRGHVLIHVALDRVADATRSATDRQLLDAVAGPLAFFEQRFGPYVRDTLDVVTVPGALSQGAPGIISIARSEVARDPRFALAHEIAHQWWGDVVGWAGERDRWLCEALAQYSAYAYLRSIGAEAPVTEAAWRQRLSAPIGGGRTIGDLGPVVLGRRLPSSLDPAGTGYVDLVYGKGALIFHTLAGWFGGDDGLLRALRDVLDHEPRRMLTTHALFVRLAALAPVALGPFEELFVSGTGVPDVVYRYRIERTAHRRWVIRGDAEQFAPARPMALLRRAHDGSFDVLDRAREPDTRPDHTLVLPFEVALKGGATRRGAVTLNGPATHFEIALGERPVGLALDPDQSLLVRTANETDEPELALALRGRRAAVAGDPHEAESLLRRALAIRPDTIASVVRRFEAEALRLVIRLDLAGVLIDEDRLVDARALIDELGGVDVASVRARLLRLRARLELRTGQRGPAVRALRAEVEHGGGPAGAADLVLVGLAAHEDGQRSEAEALWRSARRLGADLAPESVREQDRAGNWHRQ